MRTGKAVDPFWIEPDVLHAVGHAFQVGTTVDLAGWDPAQAKNLFAGHTVYSRVQVSAGSDEWAKTLSVVAERTRRLKEIKAE